MTQRHIALYATTVFKIRSETCRTKAQFLPKFIYDSEGKLAGPTQILPVRVCGPALVLKTATTMPQRHDIIKWKHFPLNWPFVWGIHRSPVNSPHKGQWRGALMFSLICVWINDWVNNREAGDLRHHRTHYDVTLMESMSQWDNRIIVIPCDR